MPLVQISVAQGRTPEQLRKCLAAVHEAVCASLDVPSASVRVLLTEVPPALWSSGGVTLEERDRHRQPGTAADASGANATAET
ncbi:tautomerase family protein [Streptomyces sp. KS_5]|uniref:tautomerase family protein n=1 Tax=Streptomyces sp. KS_5 TaxID=1881018 RepID=UPI00089C7FCE|nr:tautomerase family protein [Streptomyces sp. KS_5]SEE35894.1 4-oxalocrotonate tautomerase [Streptomyces sp. KS_5]